MKNQENIKAVQAFLKEALENDGIFKRCSIYAAFCSG